MSTGLQDRILGPDTHANRPATPPSPTLYSCTTHDAIERYDTAGGWVDWVLVGTSGESWEGAWSAGTYATGQIVDHDNVVYQANTTTTDEPPSADWDVLFTPTPGDGFPTVGVDWMRTPLRKGVDAQGHIAIGSLNNISDGSFGTNANSGTTSTPQDHRVDLGEAREVSSSFIRYASSGNRSDDGALQYSSDNSSWTDAVTWTNDTSLSRLHTFSPITARYWRINTTQTGNPGSTGVNVAEWRLYNGGTDYARGLTPDGSSTVNNPTNATDDDDDTSATINSGGGMPVWIRVDLGAAQTIHSVRCVYVATNSSPSRHKVQWSSDNTNWNDIGTELIMNSALEVRFDFASQSARYWRVYVTSATQSGNNVAFATLQVWGE